MKSVKYLLIVLFFFGISSNLVFAAESNSANKKESSFLTSDNNKIVQDKQVTKNNKFKQRLITKRLTKIAKRIKNNENSKYDTILLVIVAILIPPLAVLLLENGLTTNFWLDLLLTLLFYLPGLIFALYLILK
ncbi:MAG: YqaE/Pmp3 family membrane protein [Bacteroidales bacterium]|nr:YqaE/Pmp3 family membrane protein [Bacteroidales bacterium]